MVIEDLIKKILKEATTDGGGRGSYLAPLRPGLRKFEKTQLDPFNINVSNYDSPFLTYDSYDGKMNTPKKQIKKIETKAVKFSEYAKKHPVGNDDDGDNINPFPSKIGEWIEVTDNTLTEDLAVWFGEKKKPKGSSQPKGPWVDICRKVNGKHPPCGRSDASEGSYPKCRAAGVAGKMSDSEKRNACQQKRKAEKNDPQSGKGQKPVMVSHKKKTNENMKRRIITLTEDDLTRIVKRVLNEGIKDVPKHEKLGLVCKTYSSGDNFKSVDYTDLIAARLVERTSKFEITFDIEQNMTTRTLQSYEKENQEMVTISFEKPTQNFKEFLTNRFPNIDWEKTELGYIMFNKSHGNQQTFCSAVNPSPLWETYFTDNKILYNL